MPASLLPANSVAHTHSLDLMSSFAEAAESPGFTPARILAEYLIGRRTAVLDVSGRSTEGQFAPAEAVAEIPHEVLLIDDPLGWQAALLGALVPVTTYNDRIDQSRVVADRAPEAATLQSLESFESHESTMTSNETWAFVNAPKATNDLAETVARLQSRVSTLVVIGRSEAMSRAVNKELARGFARVDVSPGIGKYRMIIGSRPLATPSLASFPLHGEIDNPRVGQLQVRSHGACFSGVKSDEGSTLLIDALAAEFGAGDTGQAESTQPSSVLDLGCGNGWLLAAALTLTGAKRGVGVDVSRAAIASAKKTLEANGITAEVVLGDAAHDDPLVDSALVGASRLDPPGFDVILLNPPFHQGTTIETGTAEAMMRAASANLAPGGRVVTVFNSHLRYRERLETLIGPGEQLARNKKFTVVSNRRA